MKKVFVHEPVYYFIIMIVKSQRNVLSDCNGHKNIYTLYRNINDIKSNLAMSTFVPLN